MPTTTNYIWDEQNYLAESDVNNIVQTVYTNEPQQYGNLVSSRISGTTSYHHFDAISSTRQLTNAAGAVTDTFIDDSWGNNIIRTGTTSIALCWLGFHGYYSENETATCWVRRRAYIPTIGRWSSVDPLIAVLRRPFVYAGNGPILAIDPSGLKCFICSGATLQYRVAIGALNANYRNKPYSALAILVQGRIQSDLNMLGFGVQAPLPTTTGPDVIEDIANARAYGYYFFTLAWPICEQPAGSCRLWFQEKGEGTYDDPDYGHTKIIDSPYKDVTNTVVVQRGRRKFPFMCGGHNYLFDLIFADAPRGNTDVNNAGQRVGFKLTVEQSWKIVDVAAPEIALGTVSHTLTIAVDKNFNVTGTP